MYVRIIIITQIYTYLFVNQHIMYIFILLMFYNVLNYLQIISFNNFNDMNLFLHQIKIFFITIKLYQVINFNHSKIHIQLNILLKIKNV